MNIGTGKTVYENVLAVDSDGNPYTASTFNSRFFIDGALTSGMTLNISLSDDVSAIFSASFSANTTGFHQFELKNNITNVIYMSDIYNVKPDNELTGGAVVYVGL